MASKLPILSEWPVLRQLAHGDLTGLGPSAYSSRTRQLAPRTASADRVARSVCPYCAVGWQGCLCPKGAATFQLVTGDQREKKVLYRRPGASRWEELPLEQAMDMVAERVKRTREETWQERLEDPASALHGHRLARTLGIAHLGGATLDNEENYLLKKLYTALGIVQVENQARI